MLKKIGTVLKKVIIAFIMLYGFNVLVSSLNLYIPINVITVTVVSFLGIPGIASLVVLFYILK